MKNKPNFKNQIEKILSTFDFEGASEMFRRMEWQWGTDDNLHTPSADEIREVSILVLNGVSFENYNIGSSGRIAAIRMDGQLSLFVGMCNWIDKKNDKE